VVLKPQGSIGQPPKAKIKIFIDWSAVDQMVPRDISRDLPKVGAKHQGNIGMVQHILEHVSVAAQRHGLELIAKIRLLAVWNG
jgi:hypothetical protein